MLPCFIFCEQNDKTAMIIYLFCHAYGLATATGLTATARGMGVTGSAAIITGSILATGATIGGIIAGTVCGIEAASTTIGTFFGMLPTP